MNRSIQVEGAFGVLKSNRKFKRFLMRGKTNISTELFLLCLAFDIQKFFSKLQRRKLITCFFTDAQLCCTFFLNSQTEFSTFGLF